MAGKGYEKCGRKWPRGHENWYQCTRKAGHDGLEHVDAKSVPVGRWKEPEN